VYFFKLLQGHFHTTISKALNLVSGGCAPFDFLYFKLYIVHFVESHGS